VLVDCITLLVNNVLSQHHAENEEQTNAGLIEKEVVSEVGELVGSINEVGTGVIMVTNEVGTGIVPADRLSRLYRDLLGRTNQVLAEHADEVYLMVAGLPVMVKPARESALQEL
jgi:adenosylcobinamide kinase/adenosylcobinamide-phosphate guanylyltransferase